MHPSMDSAIIIGKAEMITLMETLKEGHLQLYSPSCRENKSDYCSANSLITLTK